MPLVFNPSPTNFYRYAFLCVVALNAGARPAGVGVNIEG